MPAENEVICYHEASHAVMFLIKNIPIRHCSVVRSGRNGGRVMTTVPFTSLEMHDLMVALAAGGAAEAKLTGRRAQFDDDDRKNLLDWACAKTGREPGSTAVAECIARYDTLAKALVEVHWLAISRVAKRLSWKGAIPAEDVQRVMEGIK